MKEKINMTIGRFQPFTIGHSNMVSEGGAKCIVYQIKPSGLPDSLASFKVSGKKVKPQDVQAVIDAIDGRAVELTDMQREMMKRPFTNDLVAKELDIVKKSNHDIIDVVYVTNMFEALARFNKFIIDNDDKYEPQFLMCGDDRVDEYTALISKYDKMACERGGEEYENVVRGRLETNVGRGRTPGVSGTAVRAAILKNDRAAFEKVMPKGTGVMFEDFRKSFMDYRDRLEKLIDKKESMVSLKEYIIEKLQFNKDFHVEDEEEDIKPDNRWEARVWIKRLKQLAEDNGMRIRYNDKSSPTGDFTIYIYDKSMPGRYVVAYDGDFVKGEPNFRTCYLDAKNFIEKYSK